MNGFFKLITPFIDPHTREKLKFNEDMRQYVPAEQLWSTFKGDLEFEYDHSVYWPALTKLCSERRQARLQRWIAGGKQIGESEDYLAGHTPVGVAGPAGAEATKAVESTDAANAIAEVTAAVADVKLEEPKKENATEVKPETAAEPAVETKAESK